MVQVVNKICGRVKPYLVGALFEKYLLLCNYLGLMSIDTPV